MLYDPTTSGKVNQRHVINNPQAVLMLPRKQINARRLAVLKARAPAIDRGDDVGASVAVTLGGEMVVDIWGGHADEAKTVPWERDTITNVWSTTKTVTFLTALTLGFMWSNGLL